MVGLGILAVFAPIKMMAITTIVLITCDFIFGVWAAKKRGEPITSAAFRRTATKFATYLTPLYVGFLVQTQMIGNLIPISNLVAGIIGLIELKSILENINEITGKDLFKELIKKLGSENDN